MHFPLENVKARPASHMRSLGEKECHQVTTRHLKKQTNDLAKSKETIELTTLGTIHHSFILLA